MDRGSLILYIHEKSKMALKSISIVIIFEIWTQLKIVDSQ